MASYKHKVEILIISMDNAKSCHEQFPPVFHSLLARQCCDKHAMCELVQLVENNHFSSYFHQQNSPLVFAQFVTTQLSPSNATMLQTPTPPPTIDAAATVAANASAIPLSPGRTTITAIAAATAANASTIIASPGGMPIAATGLNIGGAKPLVTFTPPGVGSGQQNSGFSASSQPTIQSNSGFSASSVGGLGATHPGGTSTTTQSNLGFTADSVGRLGATHLGSTNTTTGTSGSNHVPRKKGNSSMLSPYSGSIDPLSSTGIAKYINFVKSPYNKRLDCLVANRNLIFASLAEKAEQYSVAILRITTSSTGKMAGAPLTINTISSANVNLGSYLNILSKHTTKLTKDQLCAYLSWFFGAEDEPLAMHKIPSNMVACLVNLEATGNQGLVTSCKVELRC
jgi:hypothetical protein